MFCTELSFSWVRELENKKTNKLGDAVTFECELSLDDAAVEWYKGDRAIKSGDKHSVSTRGTVHRLTINDIDSKDAGEYSAVFRNKPTGANLTVEGWFKHMFTYFLTSSLLPEYLQSVHNFTQVKCEQTAK